MKIRSLPALILFLNTSLAGLSTGAVMISTGFEAPNYTVGTLASGKTPVAGSNAVNASISDTSSPFGTGQFLAMNAEPGGGFTVTAAGIDTLSTYSFDFYEPTGTNGSINFGLALNDLNADGAYSSWSVNNGAIGLGSNTIKVSAGTLPTLSVDRVYRAFVLYNGSGAPQVVSIPTGGSASLSAGQTALFFYDTTTGVYVDQGIYETTSSLVPTNFKFRGFSTATNIIYIDNFSRDNTLTLVVPEPSSLAFGALGLLGVFRRRRPLD